MECPNCGSNHNAKFCPECGAKASTSDSNSNYGKPQKGNRGKPKGCVRIGLIIIAVIIVLVIVIVATSQNKPSTSSSMASGADSHTALNPSSRSDATSVPQAQNDIWKGAGTYKVGDDIPSGLYAVECTSMNCYMEVAKDSTGTLDSILSNDNFSTHTYVYVDDGQYLKISGGRIAAVDDTEPFAPVDGKFSEGTYMVGRDIQPGEYKIVADSTTLNCYIEVSSSADGTLESIVTNDNIEAGSTTYITISDGQFLKVNGGSIIVS